MKEVINKAPHLSMKNKVNVGNSAQCGCYHCLKVFDSKEISDWTDNNQTALCPYCAVDAVLPNINDKEILQAAHKFWI